MAKRDKEKGGGREERLKGRKRGEKCSKDKPRFICQKTIILAN